MSKALDHFWLFGVRPHQDDTLLDGWNHGERICGSRITPAEGAFMLGVPNIIMVCSDGIPVPFSRDAIQYCESYRRLKRVMWGVTGSTGFRLGNEEHFVAQLANQYPNVKGAFCDDFFTRYGDPKAPDFTQRVIEDLQQIRAGLDQSRVRLPLYVVWYAQQYGQIDPKIFDYFDGITIWGGACDLPNLEQNFMRIHREFPQHKKLLGIYMYDFETYKVNSNELMAHQCNLGLKWMKEGILDGLIFEANSVMGIGLPSERWVCDWIDRVKDDEVPDTIGFDAPRR